MGFHSQNNHKMPDPSYTMGPIPILYSKTNGNSQQTAHPISGPKEDPIVPDKGEFDDNSLITYLFSIKYGTGMVRYW